MTRIFKKMSRLAIVIVILALLCTGTALAAYSWLSNRITWNVSVKDTPIILSGDFQTNNIYMEVPVKQDFILKVNTAEGKQGAIQTTLHGNMPGTDVIDISKLVLTVTIDGQSPQIGKLSATASSNEWQTFTFIQSDGNLFSFGNTVGQTSTIHIEITYLSAEVNEATIQIADAGYHGKAISNRISNSFTIQSAKVILSPIQNIEPIKEIDSYQSIEYSATSETKGYLYLSFKGAEISDVTASVSVDNQEGTFIGSEVVGDELTMVFVGPPVGSREFTFGANGGTIHLITTYHSLDITQASIQISSNTGSFWIPY